MALKNITAALFLLLAISPAFAFIGRGEVTEIGSDLSEAHRAQIQRDLAIHARAPIRSDRTSANALSWDCLFSAELLRRGEDRFAPYLEARAAMLISQATPQDNGAIAWSRGAQEGGTGLCANGGFDSFSDGTCDAPGTPYAFQSGMALSCLGRAAEVLKNRDLLASAQAGLSYWAKRTATPPGCHGCTYFWASGNPKDNNRLIRNTNIYLALAVAAGASDPQTRSLVTTAVAAEAFEKNNGNRGYFSVLDPQVERRPAEKERTENHMAGLATALLAIHHLSRDPLALELAKWNYSNWAHCNNQDCRTRPCSYWAADPDRCQASYTFAHCAFRKYDSNARANCERLISTGRGLSSTALLFIMTGD